MKIKITNANAVLVHTSCDHNGRLYVDRGNTLCCGKCHQPV
jgi:hypothetical protein